MHKSRRPSANIGSSRNNARRREPLGDVEERALRRYRFAPRAEDPRAVIAWSDDYNSGAVKFETEQCFAAQVGAALPFCQVRAP